MATTRQKQSDIEKLFGDWVVAGKQSGAIRAEETNEKLWPLYMMELMQQRDAATSASVVKVEDERVLHEERLMKLERLLLDERALKEERLMRDDRKCRERKDAKDEERTFKVEEQRQKKAYRSLHVYGQGIDTIDGENPETLREWLDQVTTAKQSSRATDEDVLELATSHSTGCLRRTILGITNTTLAPEWEVMRDEITTLLLTRDESLFLKNQLRDMTQGEDETEGAYCQRYNEAVNKAYDTTERAQANKRDLVQQFLRTLKNRSVKFHVTMSHCKTLKDAMLLCSEAGQVAKQGMPGNVVGAVTTANAVVKKPPRKEEAPDTAVQILKSLQGDMRRLCKEVGDLGGKVASCERKCDAVSMHGSRAVDHEDKGEVVAWSSHDKNNESREGRTQNRGDGREQGRSQYNNGGSDRNNGQGRYNQNGNRGGGREGNRNDNRPPLACYFCKGPHLIRNCQSKAEDEDRMRKERQTGQQNPPPKLLTVTQGAGN